MKIERVTNKTSVTIEQFAEEHDLVMVVQDPISPGRPGLDGKFRAHFKGAAIAEGGMLCSASAWGTTEVDAINECAKCISGKTIRLTGGKHINVPELVVRAEHMPLEKHPLR